MLPLVAIFVYTSLCNKTLLQTENLETSKKDKGRGSGLKSNEAFSNRADSTCCSIMDFK